MEWWDRQFSFSPRNHSPWLGYSEVDILLSIPHHMGHLVKMTEIFLSSTALFILIEDTLEPLKPKLV
jgi:hypothetical protein